MQPQFFGIKVSKNGIPVNQASDKQLVYKDDFSTKVYYDTTNSRIVEGLLPDGTYGMWVSKPGRNADDINAVADDSLIFNSNQNIFRIVDTGTTSVTVPNPFPSGSTVTATVPHSQGRPPSFSAYVNLPFIVNPSFPSDTIYGIPAVLGAVVSVNVRADSNNIYFEVMNIFSSGIADINGTWLFKYYILQETSEAV